MPYTILPDDAPAAGKYTILPDDNSVGRQIGLTARHAVEGVAALPNMLGDLLNRVLNDPGVLVGAPPGALRTGLNLGMPSQATSDLLTQAGLPQPGTPTERVVGGVSRALAGAGTSVGAAAQAPGELAALLAARPGMQAAAAATSGGAGATAHEAGANPLVELLAGMGAGMLTPGAMTLAQTAAGAGLRGGAQLLKPFTQGGREQIVGSALQRFAADPSTAAGNLDNVPTYVPGSQPTTAQAARDPGLLMAERAMASTDPQFAVRKSANNTARNAALDDIAGSPSQLDYFKTDRATAAADLYGRALAESPDATPWIKGQLTQLAERPAFQAAQKQAIDIARNEGLQLDPSNVTQVAHYTKMALDDMIEQAGARGLGNQQRGLIATRDKLVSLIESKDFAPSYREARDTYAQMSKPVNQMESLQDIQQRTRLPGPDVSGEPIISQAKWSNVVTKNIDALGERLTPFQVDRLRSIGADLDRASLSDTAGRAVGSNTFQNLSTANLIGAALGGKMANNAVAQSLARPLQWLYKIPEPQVRDLLSQAMLDPSLARALMAKATPQNVDFMAAALLDKARAIGIGATTGAVSEVAGR